MAFTRSIDIEVNTSGAAGSLNTLDSSFKRVDSSASKSAKSTNELSKSFSATSISANVLAGSIASVTAAMSVSTIVAYADAWSSAQNLLRQVTSSTSELAQVTGTLRKTAQESRTGFESTAKLYTRLTKSTKDLNLSQGELVKLTGTINKSFAVSGATAEEASNAIVQLSQALAAGALRGDEFNSVSEQGPAIMEALIKSLNLSRGELRDFAATGSISAEIVVEALQKSAGEIDKTFQNSTKTFAQLSQQARDNALEFVGSNQNIQKSVTATGEALVSLSENIDTIATGATLLSSVFVARLVPSLTNYVASTVSATTATLTQTKAVTGVSAALGVQAKSATTATISNNALALSSRAASSALALVGGPAGAAVLAAVAIASLIPEYETAEQRTIALRKETDLFVGSLKSLSDTQINKELAEINAQIVQLTSARDRLFSESESLDLPPIAITVDINGNRLGLNDINEAITKLGVQSEFARARLSELNESTDENAKGTDKATTAYKKYLKQLDQVVKVNEKYDTLKKSITRDVKDETEQNKLLILVEANRTKALNALTKSTSKADDAQKNLNNSVLASIEALGEERQATEAGERQLSLYRKTKQLIDNIEKSSLKNKKELINFVKQESEAIIRANELRKEQADLERDNQRAAEESRKAYEETYKTLSDGITDAILDFESLEDVALSVARSIARSFVQQQITAPILGSFGFSAPAASGGVRSGGVSASAQQNASGFSFGQASDLFSLFNGGSGQAFNNFATSGIGQAIGLSTGPSAATLASQYGLTTGVSGVGTGLTAAGQAGSSFAANSGYGAAGAIAANAAGLGSGEGLQDSVLGTIGYAVGNYFLPGIGGTIGSFLGTAVSGVIGTDSDLPPRFEYSIERNQPQGFRESDQRRFSGQSAFGGLSIGSSDAERRAVEIAQQLSPVIENIAAVENRIAGFLGDENLAAVVDQFDAIIDSQRFEGGQDAAEVGRDRNPTLATEKFIQFRISAVADALDGEISEVLRSLEGSSDALLANFQGVFEIQSILDEGSALYDFLPKGLSDTTTLLKNIGSENESLSQTLVRLSTSYSQLFPAQELQEIQLNKLKDIVSDFNEEFNVDVQSTEQLKTFIDTLDKTTESGEKAFVSGINLVNVLNNIEQAEAAAAQAGGALSASIEALRANYDLLLSDEEKRSRQISEYQKALSDFNSEFGQSIKNTDDLRVFIDALDEAGDTSSDALKSALQLASSLKSLDDALDQTNTRFIAEIERSNNSYISSLRTQIRAVESASNVFGRLADNIRNIQQSLVTDSTLSALSPQNQLIALRGRFEDISRRAQLGDESALSELPTVSREFLGASKDFYGQSEGYYKDFESVQKVLLRSADVADRRVNIDQEQLSVLNEQLSVLENVVIAVKQLGTLGITNPNQEIVAPTPTGATQQEIIDYAAIVFADGVTNDAARTLYNAALSTNTSLSAIDSALGYAPGTAEQWAISNGLPAFRNGGDIIGAGTGTSDSIIARVSNGEHITRATAAAKNKDTLKAINNGEDLTGTMRANVEVSSAGFSQVVEKLNSIDRRLSDIEDNQRQNNRVA